MDTNLKGGLSLDGLVKTQPTSGDGKIAKADIETVIKAVGNNAGYIALLLARLVKLGNAGEDVHIIIDTNEAVIHSGEDMFVVKADMNKLARV